MNATIGPCTVVLSGYVLEREEIKMAKITTLGESPNATLKVYQWDGNRHVEFDHLVDASVQNKGGSLIVEGTSRKMIEEIGLTPDNARVTWEVEVTGCEGCRT